MDVANASLLCEATAAAEAVQMSFNIHNGKRPKYFMSGNIFPQIKEVIKTRCYGIGIDLEIGNTDNFDWDKSKEYCGMLV